MLDIAEAVLFAQLLTYGLLFTLTRLDGIARSVPLYHGLLLAAGLIFVRIVTRVGSNERRTSDYQLRRERIIVIGANRLAASFISMLRAYAPNQEGVVAVLDEKSGTIGRSLGGVQVLGTPQELDVIVAEFAVHGVHVDRVILAGDTDLLSSAALHDVERVCNKRQLELSYLPRMLGLTEQGPPSRQGRCGHGHRRRAPSLPQIEAIHRCPGIACANDPAFAAVCDRNAACVD